MTDLEKAEIRLLLVNFAYLWNEREDDGSWDIREVHSNIEFCCNLAETDTIKIGFDDA